jgi:hypothetical protein
MRSDAVAYDGSRKISARCNNRADSSGSLPLGSAPAASSPEDEQVSFLLLVRSGRGRCHILFAPTRASRLARETLVVERRALRLIGAGRPSSL